MFCKLFDTILSTFNQLDSGNNNRFVLNFVVYIQSLIINSYKHSVDIYNDVFESWDNIEGIYEIINIDLISTNMNTSMIKT